MTINELEVRVAKLEHLVHGDVETPGLLPLIVSLAEDVHGPDGKSGMKADIHETMSALKGAKSWMAGGIAVGSVSATLIVWLIEKFVIKP